MPRDGLRRRLLIANCKAWGFERLKLIAGDVAATTREYARSQLGARSALLYLDLDNYEGTLACLGTCIRWFLPVASSRSTSMHWRATADPIAPSNDFFHSKISIAQLSMGKDANSILQSRRLHRNAKQGPPV